MPDVPNLTRTAEKATIQAARYGWVLGFTGVAVAVVLGEGQFSPWNSLVGIILLFVLAAVARNSTPVGHYRCAYDALRAVCWLIVLGVVLDPILTIFDVADRVWVLRNQSGDITFEYMRLRAIEEYVEPEHHFGLRLRGLFYFAFFWVIWVIFRIGSLQKGEARTSG